MGSRYLGRWKTDREPLLGGTVKWRERVKAWNGFKVCVVWCVGVGVCVCERERERRDRIGSVKCFYCPI